MRALGRWLAVFAGASVVLGVPVASAAERVPARLVWDGSACGEREDFVARVMRRNRAIRFVTSGEEVAVRLSIQRVDAGLDARVRIESKGRPPVVRRIQSPDCDDALDALALVVAIGVEGRPSGNRRPRPSSSPGKLRPAERPPAAPAPAEPQPVQPVDEPAAPPSVTPTAPPPAPPEPRPEQPAQPVAPAPAPDAREAPADAAQPEALPAAESAPPAIDQGVSAAEASSGGLVLAAGLAAVISTGVAPEPLLGGAVWLSAEWDRSGLWAPAVVLDALHQERDGHDDPRGQADFSLDALSVALCPLRLGRSTLELRPCVSGTFGRLESAGGQTYAPRDRTRPWSSIGVGLFASAVFGIVEVRASLAASVPSYRDSFRFGAECLGAACEADVFHRVKPLIWSGALGAGLTPR